MPFSSAATSVNALNVDPACAPRLPPIFVPTLKLYVVTPTPLTPHARFSVIATISPVLGFTIVIAAIFLLWSLRGMYLSTASLAASCLVGSSVVRMVRPPMRSRFWRSAAVAPNVGSVSSTCST